MICSRGTKDIGFVCFVLLLQWEMMKISRWRYIFHSFVTFVNIFLKFKHDLFWEMIIIKKSNIHYLRPGGIIISKILVFIIIITKLESLFLRIQSRFFQFILFVCTKFFSSSEELLKIKDCTENIGYLLLFFVHQ